MKYDIFISHASEDKEQLAKPLAEELKIMDLKVWYDEFNIKPGDSINESINEGLKNSLISIIILSKNFFKKNWTTMELGVINFVKSGKIQKFIPIYHGIDFKYVAERMPFMADIKAINSDVGIKKLAQNIHQVFIYHKLSNQGHYKNLNDLSLNDIGDFLCKIKDRNVRIVSDHIKKFLGISKVDTDMAIVKARLITEFIISNIINKNVDLETSINELRNNNSINNNIYEHFKVIERFSSNVLDDKESGIPSTSSNLELCMFSLTAILNWYYNTYFSEVPIAERTFSVIARDEVTYEDIVQSYEIEQKVFRPELISPVEEVVKWYNHNNYTMHAIRDNQNGKLIGFINMLPVTDRLYDEIQSGKVIDTHLGIDDIKTFDFPDFYKAYISSICISPDYQNTFAFKFLYDSFINLILDLALTKEIFISELLADASTPQGERLCHAAGLKFITETNHETKVFKGILIPPSIRLRNQKGQELIKFYQRKFEEFREFF